MAYIGIRLSEKGKKQIQSIEMDIDKTVSDIERELIDQFIEEENKNDHQ